MLSFALSMQKDKFAIKRYPMDINIDNVLAKIDALSQCVLKDSISPSSLAAILRDMAQYCSDKAASGDIDLRLSELGSQLAALSLRVDQCAGEVDLSDLRNSIAALSRRVDDCAERSDIIQLSQSISNTMTDLERLTLQFDDICDEVRLHKQDAASVFSLLATGTKAAISLSPSVVYRGVDTTVAVTASLKGAAGADISILRGSDTVAQGSGESLSSRISGSFDADTVLSVSAAVAGVTFSASATLYARNAVFYGFGDSAESVLYNGTKASPRTTAKGSWSAASLADGVRFFLLVPADVQSPAAFTMGGAPYVMEQSQLSLMGVQYTVFASGAVYNSGSTVTIKAD